MFHNFTSFKMYHNHQIELFCIDGIPAVFLFQMKHNRGRARGCVNIISDPWPT